MSVCCASREPGRGRGAAGRRRGLCVSEKTQTWRVEEAAGQKERTSFKASRQSSCAARARTRELRFLVRSVPSSQELPGTARNWETVFADVAELDRGSPGTQPVLGGKKEIQVQGRAEGDPSEMAVPTAGSQQEKNTAVPQLIKHLDVRYFRPLALCAEEEVTLERAKSTLKAWTEDSLVSQGHWYAEGGPGVPASSLDGEGGHSLTMSWESPQPKETFVLRKGFQK
ncbi:uncharacterized protein LOC105094285 [Camelus dromedarius]|uniref:uncharacterized protein LOC105094285 n=1 Tax=Camelus dromedarius TaxID=9838 RepID=UPI00311A09EF